MSVCKGRMGRTANIEYDWISWEYDWTDLLASALSLNAFHFVCHPLTRSRFDLSLFGREMVHLDRNKTSLRSSISAAWSHCSSARTSNPKETLELNTNRGLTFVSGIEFSLSLSNPRQDDHEERESSLKAAQMEVQMFPYRWAVGWALHAVWKCTIEINWDNHMPTVHAPS